VYSVSIGDLSSEKEALIKLADMAQGASALACPSESAMKYLKACYLQYSMPFPFDDMYIATEIDVSSIIERFGKPEAIECELKHYFNDFKNYYYLPAEDEAMHKSVAQYVDASAKQKATRETAYTKKAGHFYPAPNDTDKLLFKKSCYDTKSYILCEDAGPEVYLHHAVMCAPQGRVS